MARKKKTEEEQIITNEPEYIVCNFRTNLAKISMRTGVSVEDLRALNPDMRYAVVYIPAGRSVRIR